MNHKPKLIFCPVCKTTTVHHWVRDRIWICWCGAEHEEPQDKPEWTAEDILKREG